jgi:hypothetical protein
MNDRQPVLRIPGWVKRKAQDLRRIRQKAQEQADRALEIHSALRGRGSEFVLEFTTVVVIILAAAILGVLRILDTQQIGTLLAAIAGYVRGRATARGRGTASEVATPASASAGTSGGP